MGYYMYMMTFTAAWAAALLAVIIMAVIIMAIIDRI